MTPAQQFEGIVTGRSITLDLDPGVPDGTRISVVILSPKSRTTVERVEALPGFGALRDHPEELDEFDAWCREQRAMERASQGCEP